MTYTCIKVHLFACSLLLILVPTFGLNTDGVLLLSFKYSTLSDPLKVLESWNYDDATPCSWTGVTCMEMGLPGTLDMFRVTSLVLPSSQLLGSIPPDLGSIEHLRHLDLSENFLNGSLPSSIFNATELEVLSLSGNEISGELPDSIVGLKNLKLLNLSDNALAGKVPENLTTLRNLSVLSLKTNYFSGYVPSGFNSVQVLDLSSNLLNGSLPLNFGGDNLRYLNLSYNKLTGSISPEFGKRIPGNASIDLSFNNLTGFIPETLSLLNQRTESFRGNVDLCGKPLKNLCSIPSTLSTPPNNFTTSPAIAVIPKPLDSTPGQNSSSQTQGTTRNQAQNGLKPGTIVAISMADLTGIALLALVIFYVYQLKKKKITTFNKTNNPKTNFSQKTQPPETTATTITELQRKPTSCSSCLIIKGSGEGSSSSESTTAATSDSDNDNDNNQGHGHDHQTSINKVAGKLVIVDGETELEMETLLKASAYILGASSGGSIVYKALLANGTAFAVRRIGESQVKLKEFENQVRFIAKLRHPNLVKVVGFYRGDDDEKLVIFDHVSGGSLASFGYRKPGASPCHLPLEVRFRIARGVARGLAFIHEKKLVHGNVKPSNILLSQDMEPIISDLSLDRLVLGNNNHKATNSGHQFGSQRSTTASSTSQDHPITASPGATPSPSSASASPYQAPESLKNLKPSPKWDVYSFGIVFLELLTGRVFSERELSHWAGTAGSFVEDKNRVLRLADATIRADMEAKEDALLACFKLGFSCAAFLPQKRPSMKEAVQVLEKVPLPSTTN